MQSPGAGLSGVIWGYYRLSVWLSQVPGEHRRQKGLQMTL